LTSRKIRKKKHTKKVKVTDKLSINFQQNSRTFEIQDSDGEGEKIDLTKLNSFRAFQADEDNDLLSYRNNFKG